MPDPDIPSDDAPPAPVVPPAVAVPAEPLPPDPLPAETEHPAVPAHRADATVPEVLGRRARNRKRVTTNAPPGSDPNPSPEPPRHAAAENDEQLKRDKPPHWG